MGTYNVCAVIAALLLCSTSYPTEYTFDPGCPLDYRKAVQTALDQRSDGPWIPVAKGVDATTPGLLHFAWVNGAFDTPTVNLGVQTVGNIEVNGCAVCWGCIGTYQGQTTIWITFSAQFWRKRNGTLNAQRLKFELDTVLGE